jgi:phage gp29-like protein
MAKRTRPTRSAATAASSARPELDTEFANRLLDPFETAYMGVLRTNDPLLLERGNGGVQLYRDLKRDGKVFDGLQKRQLALIGKPWQVQPVDNKAPAATEDAEKLTAILKACSFDRICSELLEALIAGYAVAEIVWTVRDNMIVPARVVKRAQRRFVYVQKDENSAPGLHLLTRDNMLTGKPVPEKKFIVHRVNPEDDNPYGTGLGLQLYWPVFFKRKGIVAWNKLCDRFGSPTPHGKYPRGSGPKEKSTLADALRAMSSDGYLMTPEGMEIALLESKLSGNVTTQQALCEYMDDWIGAVLTGQEARSSGGGALAAAATERQDVRQDLTQADSDLLSETLNETLVAWICEYNGLAPCQVYRQIKAEDDVKAMAEADKVVSDMGFELDVDTVRAKYGEGWSKKAAAEPGGAPSPAPSPGPARDKTPNFSEVQSRDALDHLVDDALGDWEPLMSPVAAQLQALLNDAASKGETAQQLLDRLPQLLAELNVEPLQEDLARTAFAARLGANAGLENT